MYSWPEYSSSKNSFQDFMQQKILKSIFSIDLDKEFDSIKVFHYSTIMEIKFAFLLLLAIIGFKIERESSCDYIKNSRT